MCKQILVVIDMQNDFITGSLGTKEAVLVLPQVCSRIESFSGDVYYTMDTHGEDYPSTQEGSLLPVMHCIRNTVGWQIEPSVQAELDKKSAICFEKNTFGSLALAQELKVREEEIESVTLIGLCTDICVIANAMLIKAALPEAKIMIDASCCAGVSREGHNNALEAMKMCQIHIL